LEDHHSGSLSGIAPPAKGFVFISERALLTPRNAKQFSQARTYGLSIISQRGLCAELRRGLAKFFT
jgi:hypothetical protein